MSSAVKHHFVLFEPTGGHDGKYYRWECDKCLQIVIVARPFFDYMLTGVQLSEFYQNTLVKPIPKCVLERSDVIIEIPVVPVCTVCRKRYVFEPGSKGIGGALCQGCYYDL